MESKEVMGKNKKAKKKKKNLNFRTFPDIPRVLKIYFRPPYMGDKRKGGESLYKPSLYFSYSRDVYITILSIRTESGGEAAWTDAEIRDKVTRNWVKESIWGEKKIYIFIY